MMLLPKRVKDELERVRLDMTGNTQLVNNVDIIIKILYENWDISSWIIQNMYLSIMEDDCIMIQWLNENIYCCVYPNLISIDKIRMNSSSGCDHYEIEFEFKESKYINEVFKGYFENVINH
jgi:hypothetical protein